jgi:CDP-glucose 4,6-dehydratase
MERLVVASSDKAYGSQPRLPYTEDMALLGVNPYDASKACAEVLVRSYRETFGLNVAVARCANIYGGGDLNFSRLIPGTIRSVLMGERPILRSDGSPVRDFLHVDDAVAAYLTLGERFAQLDANEYAFNFGGGQPISVLEMLRRILETCDSEDLELDIRGGGVPPAEIDRQFLDSTLAGLTLDWQAAVGLDVGLERTVTWYRRFMESPNPTVQDALATAGAS